jgi:GTP cyclohydrolase I
MNQIRIEELINELLVEIGEDINREGLKETPKRVAQFWHDFINYKPGKIETVFTSVSTDQLIILKDIKVWSLCEHHLLPFWCNVSVAYLSDNKIVGISKLARIIHQHAHKFQVQERLVNDILMDVKKLTGSENVAVIGQGEHLCMLMRGIQTNAIMVSSALSGQFRDNYPLRAEFLNLVKKL